MNGIVNWSDCVVSSVYYWGGNILGDVFGNVNWCWVPVMWVVKLGLQYD